MSGCVRLSRGRVASDLSIFRMRDALCLLPAGGKAVCSVHLPAQVQFSHASSSMDRWGNSLCGFHPHPGRGMTSDGRTARPSEGPAHFVLLCQGRRKRSFLVSGAEALSRGLCESRPGNSRWRRGRERTTPSGSWRVSKFEFLRAGQEAADRPLGGRGRGVRPDAVAAAHRCMPPIATTAEPRSPTGTASPPGRAYIPVPGTLGRASRSTVQEWGSDPAGCPCRSSRTTSDS